MNVERLRGRTVSRLVSRVKRAVATAVGNPETAE